MWAIIRNSPVAPSLLATITHCYDLADHRIGPEYREATLEVVHEDANSQARIKRARARVILAGYEDSLPLVVIHGVDVLPAGGGYGGISFESHRRQDKVVTRFIESRKATWDGIGITWSV